MPDTNTRRILFVGDMHLGRRPSGVPAAVATDLRFGPEEAWRRVIRLAVDHEVSAVALAGDLVHRDNALFEAFGHLCEGVEQLARAGIEVCAVAGNHDTEALPRLAALIPEFQLLGAGGTWSEHIVAGGFGPAVRLVGWSFPAKHHSGSPLASAPPPADPAVITFGLLHADLDASASRYAPVAGAELRALNYAGWYLGHIHRPEPVPLPPVGTPLYLGSLSPLDPSETGSHGPLLVTVDAEGVATQRRLACAPLRWDHLEWSAEQIGDDLAEFQAQLLARLIRRAGELADELDSVDALGFRVRITGRHRLAATLERHVRALPLELLRTRHGGVEIFVQRIDSFAVGSYDLEELAHRMDPPGLLARRILLLRGEGDDPELAALLGAARSEIEAADRAPAFTALAGDEPPDDDALRGLLLHTCSRALDELMETPEAQHGAS